MQNRSKSELRSEILSLLRAQTAEDRSDKSGIVQNKLFEQPEYQQAKTILCYASFDGEVETLGIMEQALKDGKTVSLPIIIEESKQVVPHIVDDLEHGLETGPYGIKQPNTKTSKAIEIDHIDLVIVPGVAFDRQSYRLGRGQGYYDRFLDRLSPSTSTIGLAFDFQIVDRLPELAAHDLPVKRVLFN